VAIRLFIRCKLASFGQILLPKSQKISKKKKKFSDIVEEILEM